jgi:hypothetical protein
MENLIGFSADCGMDDNTNLKYRYAEKHGYGVLATIQDILQK